MGKTMETGKIAPHAPIFSSVIMIILCPTMLFYMYRLLWGTSKLTDSYKLERD